MPSATAAATARRRRGTSARALAPVSQTALSTIARNPESRASFICARGFDEYFAASSTAPTSSFRSVFGWVVVGRACVVVGAVCVVVGTVAVGAVSVVVGAVAGAVGTVAVVVGAVSVDVDTACRF